MRKILSISIAIIYLAISSGIVLQVHYCMGKASGSKLSYAQSDDHACAKCGMEKGKGKCCHDEVKLLKVDDAHKQVDQAKGTPAPDRGEAVEFNLYNPLLPASHIYEKVNINDPPDPGCQPSPIILNCTLRI